MDNARILVPMSAVNAGLYMLDLTMLQTLRTMPSKPRTITLVLARY